MADPILIPETGRLAVMVVKVPSYLRTLTLHLFKNNVVPLVTSVVGLFVEATFPGYVSQSLNDFSDPYINADNESQSDSAVHTFLCSGVPSGGSQSIYGWYTTDAAGVVGPVARFTDGPIALTGAGQSISIQIHFEDGALSEE